MRVAVAVIRDAEGHYLITRRSMQVSHGGYWEFPGGKLEAGESGDAALLREIQEEVGLTVNAFQFLGCITHHYPDRFVELLIYLVEDFTGQASCQEGQLDLRWIPKDQFSLYQFPQANLKILDLF